MNLKVVSMLVLVVFLSGMFVPVSFADDCGVTKTDIIKSIIAHITQKSDITREQVIHLIKAYLGSADCDSNDVREAKEKADNIDSNVIPRCSDGTLFAHCSVKNKPKYCYSGRLVNRCDLCCESGRCGPDGRCEGSEDDDACTGSDKPRCCAIGSRSEGWYQDGRLIKWDNCDGCYAVCKAVGSRSEGWYSSCGNELIKYDKCEEPVCEDLCGDGICQKVVCQGIGCPCAETPENCPEDCCVDGDGVCREGCTPENDDECSKTETICTDGIDNDGDGLIDNEDGDCWSKEPVFIEDYDPLPTFKDLEALLPSLKESGIKTIELQGIYEHCTSGDHGYRWQVRDYFKLDPARGTQADLESFLAQAHRLDMKVISFISLEDATPPKFLWETLFTTGLSGYDKDGIGGHFYRYQIEHPEKQILLRDISGDFACHPYGWGYAIDCSSEEVAIEWEKILKHLLVEQGFDGLRVDSLDKNYCHKGETIYIRCKDISCSDPVDGEYPSLPLYRKLKEMVKPDQIFISEGPSTMSAHVKWFCEFPYYPPYPDMDEVAEVSEDYGFTPILLRIVLSGEGPVQKELEDTLFNIVARTEEKIGSEDLVNWVNKQYAEHVLHNRERFRFVRNWNYLEVPFFKFISTDGRYFPAVTLTSTIRGVPKASYYELFGHPDEDTYFLDAQNTPEMRQAHWKKILNIRNSNNALKYGSMENVWKSGDNTYAYLREYEDEKVIVVINFLDREAASDLDLSFFPEGTVLYDELNDEEFTIDNPSNSKISVPKYGSRILVLKR